MRKHLTRIGNSLGLVLDRPLLEKMGIDGDTELEVSSDGTCIGITPVRGRKRDAKLKQVADGVFDEFAGAFKKLAE